MRHVVLVRLPSGVNVVTPPLGIGYLLKVLQEVDGIEPVFWDMHRDRMNEESLLNKLEGLNPIVVGFQVFSADYHQFRGLVPRVRGVCPESKIIAGGPHISGLPEQTLIDNPQLDFAVRGEGEELLKSLVRSLLEQSLDDQIAGIPNLVYRRDDRIVMNPIEFVDVNKYGMPAWKLLEPDRYPPTQHGTFHKSDQVVPILTSRGCPYPCTFCAGHLITGKRVRTRDIQNVVEEILFLKDSYGFQEFIIEDENFTFYKDHVLKLSQAVRDRKIKSFFSLPSGVRMDKLDEEIVRNMKEMGVYMVTVGIESGSVRVLKEMKKEWDLTQVKEKIRLLQKYKILVMGSFILGFSNETMEDIKKTIRFSIESGVNTAYFGNYLPLPGSDDFNQLIRRGEIRLDEIDWARYTSYFGKIPYHPPGISERELLSAVRWATIRFYSRPKILWGLLRRMTHLVFLRSLMNRVVSLFKRHSS